MAEAVESMQEWSELLRLGSDGGEYDDELAAELVAELNRRGEPDVVSWALPMLSHVDAWHRQAAAWVLGQHGFRDGRPFGTTVMPALAAAARSERDDETRLFLVTALGHGEDPGWVDELLQYATDPYAPVRESVAGALPIMFAGDPMSDEAVEVLIGLTRDADRRVRDWATMSLASLTEQDSDAIREALRARLDDAEDADDETATAGEAALGPALRRDPSVYAYLERWLSAEPTEIGNLTVEAAGALGDQRLLPALQRLRATNWQESDPRPGVLDDAVGALQRTARLPRD